MVRTLGNGHRRGSTKKYVLQFYLYLLGQLFVPFLRRLMKTVIPLFFSYFPSLFLTSYSLFLFQLDICFQLLEALEDDYKPTSSSRSTVRVTGEGNVNRPPDGSEDAYGGHTGIPPHTNGIDGNNLNLIGTARTYSSEGESKKVQMT